MERSDVINLIVNLILAGLTAWGASQYAHAKDPEKEK